MCHTEIITEVETEIAVFISYSHRDVRFTSLSILSNLSLTRNSGCSPAFSEKPYLVVRTKSRGTLMSLCFISTSSMPSIEPNLVPYSL